MSIAITAELVTEATNEGFREGVAQTEAQMGQAIRLLGAKIVDLEARVAELQAHNTELLLRARKAEGEAAELRTAFELYMSASQS